MLQRLPILALLLGLTVPAAANNTSKEVELQVTLHDGTVLEGRVRFKKSKLEVKGRKTKKLKYTDVSTIGMVPATDPDKLLRLFERKKKRLKDVETAKDWARLGKWAEKKGLLDQADEVYEYTLKLDPDQEDARNATGWIRDGEEWVTAMALLGEKREAVPAGDNEALMDLARYAIKHGQREHAFRYLCEVMRADIFHADALKLARPYTDAHVQRTQPMVWPMTGRWKISPDRTRHHQKKSYAVYALDLNKVDESGKHYSGSGKKLTDYYAWDAPFYAMAAGTVVEVREGREDNPVGKLKGKAEKHNGVSIDHGNGELSWYVHAKKGSIVVKLGDKVEAGQLLGTVGNSGGSAIPHLHITLVSYGTISVPWTCDGFTLIAPDGTPIPVTRAWPREGWTIETPERDAK